MIGLQIQVAEKLDTHPDPYSTLIDLYEPGATYDWIANIFNKSKLKLNQIIKKLDKSSDKPDFSILKQKWDKDSQWNFSIEVVKGLNYDFNKGRQDKSVHRRLLVLPIPTVVSIDLSIVSRQATETPRRARQPLLQEPSLGS